MLEQDLLSFFDNLQLMQKSTLYVDVAKALAGIFALFQLSFIGFRALSGDSKIDIMPLLRPFGMGFIIIFWSSFLVFFDFIGSSLEHEAKNLYTNTNEETRQLLTTRADNLYKIKERLAEEVGKLEVGSASGTNGADAHSFSLLFMIKESTAELIFNASGSFLETAFKGCVYGIFFLKGTYTFVLAVLGPFAFAFSIAGPFRNAFVLWISRFISLWFYGTIAYISLYVAIDFINLSLTIENAELENIINYSERDFFTYCLKNRGWIDVFYYPAALLVGVIGMITVPVYSTWIVSKSNGVNVFVNALSGNKT